MIHTDDIECKTFKYLIYKFSHVSSRLSFPFSVMVFEFLSEPSKPSPLKISSNLSLTCSSKLGLTPIKGIGNVYSSSPPFKLSR